MVCEQAPDCTTAGVEAGTLQGDMQVSFIKTPGEHTHKLTFGSIGDDYFRDNQYDRELIVKIKNLKKLSEFTLRRVEYDDWLIVKVNDTIVYSSYNNQMFYADFKQGIWRTISPVYDEKAIKLVSLNEKLHGRKT